MEKGDKTRGGEEQLGEGQSERIWRCQKNDMKEKWKGKND